MAILGDLLRHLSAAGLGVFAGAMLTEGAVLVPFWRALPAADFFAWYAANDRRLLGFFGPLTSGTALTAIAAAGASVWEGHPGRWLAVAAAGIAVAVVSTFFLYFQRANDGFSTASITPGDLPNALGRWAAWHRMRTVLSFVALACAVAAL